MGDRLMQRPFFGAALYRFVPTVFIQGGKTAGVNALYFRQVIG